MNLLGLDLADRRIFGALMVELGLLLAVVLLLVQRKWAVLSSDIAVLCTAAAAFGGLAIAFSLTPRTSQAKPGGTA